MNDAPRQVPLCDAAPLHAQIKSLKAERLFWRTNALLACGGAGVLFALGFGIGAALC